jgi:hypothetical protein
LSPQQQEEHRVKIGVRAQAILGQFWRDDSTPDAVQALELEGWMDVLENCSHSEIRKAWSTYQRTGPRTQSGKLYKPDAGALYQIIARSRPKPKAVEARPMTADERKAFEQQHRQARKIDPERAAQAQAILDEFGFAKKMPGVAE